MKRLFPLVLAVVLAFGILGFANAEVVDMGTFTYDSDTGLDWLDVTHTINLSFSDVQSELGEGGSSDDKSHDNDSSGHKKKWKKKGRHGNDDSRGHKKRK